MDNAIRIDSGSHPYCAGWDYDYHLSFFMQKTLRTITCCILELNFQFITQSKLQATWNGRQDNTGGVGGGGIGVSVKYKIMLGSLSCRAIHSLPPIMWGRKRKLWNDEQWNKHSDLGHKCPMIIHQSRTPPHTVLQRTCSISLPTSNHFSGHSFDL